MISVIQSIQVYSAISHPLSAATLFKYQDKAGCSLNGSRGFLFEAQIVDSRVDLWLQLIASSSILCDYRGVPYFINSINEEDDCPPGVLEWKSCVMDLHRKKNPNLSQDQFDILLAIGKLCYPTNFKSGLTSIFSSMWTSLEGNWSSDNPFEEWDGVTRSHEKIVGLEIGQLDISEHLNDPTRSSSNNFKFINLFQDYLFQLSHLKHLKLNLKNTNPDQSLFINSTTRSESSIDSPLSFGLLSSSLVSLSIDFVNGNMRKCYFDISQNQFEEFSLLTQLKMLNLIGMRISPTSSSSKFYWMD